MTKNDEELEELFGAGQYPDTRDLTLGEVIRKCWAMQYIDAGEAAADIRQIENRLKT